MLGIRASVEAGADTEGSGVGAPISLLLAGELPDKADHLRRGYLGLFQRQEMCCPGTLTSVACSPSLLLEVDAVFRGRDLIIRSLQDQIFGLSRWCPPGLRGVASAAAFSMAPAPGSREGLKSPHTRAESARIDTRYGMTAKTSASVDDGLKITINGMEGGRLGLNLSARSQQNDATRQLSMRRGKHAGDAIAEVVSGHVNRTQFQACDDARHIVCHRLKRDPVARACTFARTPEVDTNHLIARLWRARLRDYSSNPPSGFHPAAERLPSPSPRLKYSMLESGNLTIPVSTVCACTVVVCADSARLAVHRAIATNVLA